MTRIVNRPSERTGLLGNEVGKIPHLSPKEYLAVLTRYRSMCPKQPGPFFQTMPEGWNRESNQAIVRGKVYERITRPYTPSGLQGLTHRICLAIFKKNTPPITGYVCNTTASEQLYTPSLNRMGLTYETCHKASAWAKYMSDNPALIRECNGHKYLLLHLPNIPMRGFVFFPSNEPDKAYMYVQWDKRTGQPVTEEVLITSANKKCHSHRSSD